MSENNPMAAGKHPYDPLGFAGIEPGMAPAAKEFFEKQAGEAYKLACAIKNVLDSDDGKIFAEWLRGLANAPTWMPSIAKANGMDAACAHGFAREGQNSLIQNIFSHAEAARQCNSPQEFGNLFNKMFEGSL